MSAEILYLHVSPRGEAAVGPGASYPVLPVGAVAHMNRLVAEGFDVVGMNVPVERIADPAFTLESWLASNPPAALVLLDLHWAEHALGVVDAVGRIREHWPASRIIAGGLTATRFPEELLALAPGLDGVLVGDAEGSVVELARAVQSGRWPPAIPGLYTRHDGQILPPQAAYHTSHADFDALDTVSLSWLRHADLYRRLLHSRPPRAPSRADLRGHWLASGRGCAFECDYCGGSRSSHERLTGRRGLLRRPPERLAADVARLVEQGVDQIALSLDPDMLGPAHRAAFFDRLRVQPGLYVESFQLPSLPLLDALAAHADPAHSELAITPLSGDLHVRRRNGKHYDNQALLDRLDASWARDISIFLFFSLNLPGEDEHTLPATLDLTRRLLDRAPPGLLRIISICHTLDPGSPLAEAGGLEIGFHRLEDWVAHGRQPRPWTFYEGERGFSMPGRDLPAMVGRWDALCAETDGVLIPVPRV